MKGGWSGRDRLLWLAHLQKSIMYAIVCANANGRRWPQILTTPKPTTPHTQAMGAPTLVFCASRRATEACAQLLAELLPSDARDAEGRRALLAELSDALGAAPSPALAACIPSGIAYHHAGLTTEERSAVEHGFRAGLLRILAATSTLAAGVNLPARRVVLRSLWMGPGPMGRQQYLQMVGRAGRAGHADAGESFLMVRGPPGGRDWREATDLLHQPLPAVQSQLLGGKAGGTGPAAPPNAGADDHMELLLLTACATRLASHERSIKSLLRCTLASRQLPWETVEASGKSTLRRLRCVLVEELLGLCLLTWRLATEGKLCFDDANW